MKRPTVPLILVPSLLTSLASAISHDCSHMRTNGKKFNFENIGGPHSVSVIEDKGPSTKNTTWTIDICQPLHEIKTIPDNYQCETGAWVCGVTTVWNPDSDNKDNVVVEAVYSVAGNFVHGSGRVLDPHYEILKDADDKADGLEVILNGGKIDGREQQAVIEFQCDASRSGNEGKADSASKLTRRDDKEEGDGDHKEDDTNSLSFVSYGGEDNKKDMDVLRMKWKTKYACEDYEDDDDEENGSKKKSRWGFFTWIIVLFFLGTAAYLIFGSWLNYNRYGARGWDLLPHGDTIRDIPYLFKDWSRKVVDTVSGQGSRGGYSAV